MDKEIKLPEGNKINYCQNCDENTIHILHGYTEKGILWKGHICLCKNWHCSKCEKLSVGIKGRECCR